jgi:hypothetical protein
MGTRDENKILRLGSKLMNVNDPTAISMNQRNINTQTILIAVKHSAVCRLQKLENRTKKLFQYWETVSSGVYCRVLR